MCWTKTIASFCYSVLLPRPIPLASQMPLSLLVAIKATFLNPYVILTGM